MQKIVQKAEYRALFLWNMSYIFSILYEFLQRSGKRFVLLLRAFGRPFRVLAGTEELFVFIPTGQQAIDILSRVLQTVLVEHSGPPGQAHGGEAIVLVMTISPGVTRLTSAKSTLSAPLSKTSVSAPSRAMRWAVSHRIFTGTPWGRPIRTVRSTTGQPSASIKIVGIVFPSNHHLWAAFSFYCSRFLCQQQ